MATENQSATLAPPLPRPPGTEAILSLTCKDVVMGRGSGAQNHCGNVTYRKLVCLNKELYVSSSKFDKIKISRAIVAATRWFGGRFVQADPKRGGLYFDIGDKHAWSKTSQALREGQAEVRARVAEEDPTGREKIAKYKQVISEQTFFAYACRMMQSLYQPANDGSGISACGPQCPYAVWWPTLNQLGAGPFRIYSAMQMLAAPACQPYNMGMISGGASISSTTQTSSANLDQRNIDSSGPQPLPLPNASKNTPRESITTETATPIYTSYPSSLDQVHVSASTPQQESLEPLSHQDGSHGPLKPELVSDAISGGGSPSRGSIFALREFCSEDREIISEGGHALIDQEVHDLILQKSHSLVKIDTTQAFDDLVLKENNVTLAKPKEDDGKESGITLKERTCSGSFTSEGSSARNSSSLQISSMYSKLSHKDDSSLMNMAPLSLSIEKRDESNASPNDTNSPNNKISKDESNAPKSIIKHHGPSLPIKKRKRENHVSWAEKKKKISLMSLNDGLQLGGFP